MTSTRILDALDQHFIRLMRNWALASAGGIARFATTSAYDGMPGADGYDSSMPILMGEAQDVDAAIVFIALEQRLAVSCYWFYEGRSMAWMSRRVKCSDNAFVDRCLAGHAALQGELRKRRQVLIDKADAAKKYLTTKAVRDIVKDVG